VPELLWVYFGLVVALIVSVPLALIAVVWSSAKARSARLQAKAEDEEEGW
jgi:type II secretory pathway pseudopilin PulG